MDVRKDRYQKQLVICSWIPALQSICRIVYRGSFSKVSGVFSTHDIFHTNDSKFVIEKVVIRYL